jgi:PAS domain S-box-containing protein
VEEATVAMAVYTGPEMKIELANDAMILLWGKDRSVIGKTLSEALPELNSQPFGQLLKEVYETGNTYWGEEQIVDLLIDNRMQSGYFNFSYKPLYNEKGETYGILNMAEEVTEIVRSKTVLKESEARFRQMADLMPTKVTNTDAQGNFIYFNQGWVDYTGLSLGELKTQGWIRFIHPDHRQQFEKLWEHSLQTGEDLEMEIKCLNKNGEYKWHINRAEAVKDESGKIKMWIGATIDIQEQKEVVENLEYGKALLEAYNQANLDGVLLVDTKGEIISFNHRFVEIWNMPQRIIDSRDDDAALRFAEKQLISPDQFLDKVKNLYKTTPSTQVDTDVLRFKDGKIIERYGYPVKGEDGTFYAWSWTFRDITEMERSKSLLKESESHFRQLSNVIPNKVSHTDSEGTHVYFNQSWLDYTGVGIDELRKDGWFKFVHPNEREDTIRKWKRSLLTEGKFEMEARFLNKSGRYKWHIIRAEAINEENGKLKMWVGTTTEIHKIKEEEKRKEDFLKMVSHELKTPVTSIKGYVQLLLSILNSKQDPVFESIPLKPSLERIDHQIIRLTRLISEILDLTRIEEDELQLQKSFFSLNGFIDQTVQDIRYTNTQHLINVEHDYRCNIYADKDRIGQVLINFITNAIKYSPDHNEIKVCIEEIENNLVQVTVKDKGIGIDKAFHKNVFKKFYRIGGKNEDTYSGFGIGLFLSNEIIQRHKGFVKVKSKLGQGSDFSFTLSVAAENQDKSKI